MTPQGFVSSLGHTAASWGCWEVRPKCAGVGNMHTGTWTYGSWITGSKCGKDVENAMLIPATAVELQLLALSCSYPRIATKKSHLNAMIHKSFARVSNMFQVFCLLCISIKSIFQSSHNLTVTNEVWLLCSCERHLSHVSGWVCDSA